jgi:hypothetical protein
VLYLAVFDPGSQQETALSEISSQASEARQERAALLILDLSATISKITCRISVRAAYRIVGRWNTVEPKYQIPEGSDDLKEVAKCLAYCRAALT